MKGALESTSKSHPFGGLCFGKLGLLLCCGPATYHQEAATSTEDDAVPECASALYLPIGLQPEGVGAAPPHGATEDVAPPQTPSNGVPLADSNGKPDVHPTSAARLPKGQVGQKVLRSSSATPPPQLHSLYITAGTNTVTDVVADPQRKQQQRHQASGVSIISRESNPSSPSWAQDRSSGGSRAGMGSLDVSGGGTNSKRVSSSGWSSHGHRSMTALQLITAAGMAKSAVLPPPTSGSGHHLRSGRKNTCTGPPLGHSSTTLYTVNETSLPASLAPLPTSAVSSHTRTSHNRGSNGSAEGKTGAAAAPLDLSLPARPRSAAAQGGPAPQPRLTDLQYYSMLIQICSGDKSFADHVIERKQARLEGGKKYRRGRTSGPDGPAFGGDGGGRGAGRAFSNAHVLRTGRGCRASASTQALTPPPQGSIAPLAPSSPPTLRKPTHISSAAPKGRRGSTGCPQRQDGSVADTSCRGLEEGSFDMASRHNSGGIA